MIWGYPYLGNHQIWRQLAKRHSCHCVHMFLRFGIYITILLGQTFSQYLANASGALWPSRKGSAAPPPCASTVSQVWWLWQRRFCGNALTYFGPQAGHGHESLIVWDHVGSTNMLIRQGWIVGWFATEMIDSWIVEYHGSRTSIIYIYIYGDKMW